MESIIAVSIAVLGWLVNHLLSLRAQKTAFLNQIRNNARAEVTSSLRRYLNWLDELSRINAFLHALNSLHYTEKEWIKKFSELKQELRTCVQAMGVEPNCIPS